jgi:Ser/Thr protein kinase RdoA (MazF antagonist)
VKEIPLTPLGPEVPLPRGDVTEGVVRVGDTVRRPRGPWSSSVAAYLRHLQQVGFDGAPRYIGLDERGRDVLEFVAGEVPGQPVVEAWAATTPVLIAVAALLRRLHEASADFAPPHDACWFGQDIHVELPADLPPEPPADVVSHFDVTPQNVVFRNGEPVALIDFDLTRPGSRLRDVVNTAMWWVPLRHPEDLAPHWRSLDAPARLRLFADAYELGRPEREAFVALAIARASASRHRMRAAAEQLGGGWARMWTDGVGEAIARREEWLTTHRRTLEAALAR